LNKGETKRKTHSILFSFLILTAILCVSIGATSNASADWYASATYSPSSAYIGDTVSFKLYVTDTGSHSIDFSSATLKIDWGSITTSKSLYGTMSVISGSTTTLTSSFVVPDVAAGTYQMEVTLAGKANGDWLSSSRTYSSDLTVKEIPALFVSIQASKTAGTTPLSTTFTSTIQGGVSSYTYSWTFGDGATSSAANPSHTYTSIGTYTAKLIVADSKGQSASDTTTVSVTALPLTVSISAEKTSGTASFTASFTSTVNGGTTPYTYAWTFGDGATSSSTNPDHTYTKAGTYTAKLIITDKNGQTASDTITITVNSADPLDIDSESGSAGSLIIIGLIVLVIIVLVLAVVLWRKKKKGA
jgi:PKD repeat protein